MIGAQFMNRSNAKPEFRLGVGNVIPREEVIIIVYTVNIQHPPTNNDSATSCFQLEDDVP